MDHAYGQHLHQYAPLFTWVRRRRSVSMYLSITRRFLERADTDENDAHAEFLIDWDNASDPLDQRVRTPLGLRPFVVLVCRCDDSTLAQAHCPPPALDSWSFDAASFTSTKRLPSRRLTSMVWRSIYASRASEGAPVMRHMHAHMHSRGRCRFDSILILIVQG